MARRRISQSALARKLDIRPQAVNQWFKPDGTAPRGKRLQKIAEIVGVELSELLADTPGSNDPRLARIMALWPKMAEPDRDTLDRIAARLMANDHPPAAPIPPEEHPPPDPRVGGSVAENEDIGDCAKAVPPRVPA